MKTEFEYKGQMHTLYRYPLLTAEKYQAWNAADELMIQHIDNLDLNDESRILIINDQFGFLAKLSEPYHRESLLDTYTALNSSQKNNAKTTQLKHLRLFSELNGIYDLVLIHMPKSMHQLQFILASIQDHLHEASLVIAGFMTKYFTRTMIDIFADHFENVVQGKAEKKSRLIIANQKKKAKVSVEADSFSLSLNGNEYSIFNYPGVFSYNKLDLGTRFLLDHLPKLNSNMDVLDLGCGSAVISLAAIVKENSLNLVCLDDSFYAIESAKKTLSSFNAEFIVSNTLNEFSDHSFDLILSNPPFHFAQEINQERAIQIIKSCYRVLKSGGEFRFVLNKHLGYLNILNDCFDQVSMITENKQYRIFSALKK